MKRLILLSVFALVGSVLIADDFSVTEKTSTFQVSIPVVAPAALSSEDMLGNTFMVPVGGFELYDLEFERATTKIPALSERAHDGVASKIRPPPKTWG